MSLPIYNPPPMEELKKEVERIAKLARLRLEAGEHEKLGKQFSELIQHFAKIQELDTEGVAPTSYPFARRNVLREDRESPAPSSEENLRNAPERHEDFYKVPTVIEG